MPGKHVGGVDIPSLLSVVILLAVIFSPMLFSRRKSPPGPSDSDSDDGWGRGPEPPRTPPEDPRGGIPLDHAIPARVRLRSHGRLADLVPHRQRRPAREPDRRPTRTPTIS